jgi:hypothetical protein
MSVRQAEAGSGVAAVGMSGEVVARLQERATALTQERKRRGRTVPEGLLPPDQLRVFLTLASHPVRTLTSCSSLSYLLFLLLSLPFSLKSLQYSVQNCRPFLVNSIKALVKRFHVVSR